MIIQDDILHWAETYEGEPFMAALIDPPYHLVSINKRFSKPGSKPAQYGKDGAFQRASKGFMQTDWDGVGEDGQGIAFRPETWAALAQHLYPGAFIMAFASSRGWHRMAVAMEDAGLILHPSLFMFGWCYLSGFPKSTRIDTQLDRQAGVIDKREEYTRPDFEARSNKTLQRHSQVISGQKGKYSLPATPLAQAWAGHRYGGQMIKPAIEPIIVAQVPYRGRPIENIVETGAGALWIDGGRIPTEQNEPNSRQSKTKIGINKFAHSFNGGWVGNGEGWVGNNGRWPSNLILHCSCSPTRPDKSIHDESCAVCVLDGQSGELKSGGGDKHSKTQHGRLFGLHPISGLRDYESDSGPASRMFYQSNWSYEVAEQLAAADSIRYEPKASSNEREIGLDDLETQTRHRVNAGGLENEPRFAPTQVKNIHPCCKPISLTKYLATLLLPPAQYAPRRILIPFCGVASEYIGAMLAGFEEIVGIERETNYVEIARERAKWWGQWPGWGQTDVDKILASDEGEQQLRMF